MALYQRRTLVDAPFEQVWAMHATVDGLTAVTPDWLGLAVEAIVGPDGGEPKELVPGTQLELRLRPLGLLPAVSWTARITGRDVGATAAWFRDEMVAGPFRRWTHTHRFTAVDGRTRIEDRIEYELPIGPFSDLSTIAHPGFAAMFRDRHRRTKAILEP